MTATVNHMRPFSGQSRESQSASQRVYALLIRFEFESLWMHKCFQPAKRTSLAFILFLQPVTKLFVSILRYFQNI